MEFSFSSPAVAPRSVKNIPDLFRHFASPLPTHVPLTELSHCQPSGLLSPTILSRGTWMSLPGRTGWLAMGATF